MLEKNLKKEVLKMIGGIIALCVVMNIIFLILGYYNISVLYGSLLGGFVSILNYFFLALTVQKVVEKEPNVAKAQMNTSYILRMILILATVFIAIKLPYFNYLAVAIPFVFPRLVIMIFNIACKKKGGEKS